MFYVWNVVTSANCFQTLYSNKSYKKKKSVLTPPTPHPPMLLSRAHFLAQVVLFSP